MIYLPNNPNNQLEMLNILILNTTNKHISSIKTKIIRSLALWKKDFMVNRFQKEEEEENQLRRKTLKRKTNKA